MKRRPVNSQHIEKSQTAFPDLTPDVVLAAVEEGLGMYLSNLCRPMNSYINRVYELADEDGEGLIVKFYRPTRWSQQALQDEHDFLLELAAREVPVIAPLPLVDGTTLGRAGKVFFAVFPKKWGRSVDEYSDDQWLELGHLIGRTHAVGAGQHPGDRITMVPEQSTRSQADYILDHDLVPEDLVPEFRSLTDTLIAETMPLFADAELICIHGDCHSANLVYRPGESFYIIDFDDMAIGPPVQDLWMLLPAVPEESLVEIDIFLEGYRVFRDFDLRSLKLIEPLRAMRFIHYIAWCAHQVIEDGSSVVMPNFGTRDYWQHELGDLADQLQRIKEQPESYFP
ncbi:MAG TPA: serine/threonine protein kinase [Desulfobulbus sp.]|nr:serine/threonine protein kinase [Desulfobulbus sp.]